MEDTYLKLRSIVFEYLRKNPRSQLGLVDGGSWPSFLAEYGLPWSDDYKEIIQQIFHDLYLERVIMTGNGPQDICNAMTWPFYRLTDYGKSIIQEESYSPYDPSGYVIRIKTNIPMIDQVIVDYLGECLNCFRMGYLFASAVMLGCAAEKAMLLLVESFGSAIVDQKKKTKYEKETRAWQISRKYDAFWKRVQPLMSSLPSELSEDLHTILDRVFDLIRTVRNDAGHPTGKRVDRHIAYANLVLFPSYCQRVYALMNYFKKNPTI